MSAVTQATSAPFHETHFVPAVAMFQDMLIHTMENFCSTHTMAKFVIFSQTPTPLFLKLSFILLYE